MLPIPRFLRRHLPVLVGQRAIRKELPSSLLQWSYGDWNSIFADNVIASAILDRLLHHFTTINITGKSYGLKGKRIRRDCRQAPRQKWCTALLDGPRGRCGSGLRDPPRPTAQTQTAADLETSKRRRKVANSQTPLTLEGKLCRRHC